MEDSYGSLALTSEYINDQALPKEVCRPPGVRLLCRSCAACTFLSCTLL